MTDFQGQEMTYCQGLGVGEQTGREHHPGLLFGSYPLSCSLDDPGICDPPSPKPLAHFHFLGGPHQPASLLCSSQLILPGTPPLRHVPFLSSLRGLIEGEQEISLVPSQPQQGLVQCHILCYLKGSASGCSGATLFTPPGHLTATGPYLLVPFSYLLLA